MIIKQFSKLITVGIFSSVFVLAGCVGDSDSNSITPAPVEPSVYGNALYLDGNNGLVSIAGLTADKTYSISAWVNVDINYSDYNTMFDFNNEPSMGLDDGAFYNIYHSAVCCGSFLLSDLKARNKTWVHLTFIYGGGVFYIYKNGVEFGTVTDTPLVLSTVNPLVIGGLTGGSEYTKGYMDEIAVWNKELTADEVKTIMGTILTGTEEGLVALYNFESQEINEDGATVTKNIVTPGTYDGVLEYGASVVPSTL